MSETDNLQARIAELDEICRRSLARATKSENTMVAMQAELEKLRTANSQLAGAAIRNDCNWFYEEDTDMYETGCGHAFCFTDGDPEENFFRFCYHCGGNLVLAAQEPKQW